MTNLEHLTTVKAAWEKIQKTGKNPDGTLASKNAVAGASAVIAEINRRIKEIMETGI